MYTGQMSTIDQGHDQTVKFKDRLHGRGSSSNENLDDCSGRGNR